MSAIKKIDDLGRLVIPYTLRRKIGLENLELANIELEDDKIIITKAGENLKEKIEKRKDEYKVLLNQAIGENRTTEIDCYTGYIAALEWVLEEKD